MARTRLLVMDDDSSISGFFASVAETAGFAPREVNDPANFFAAVSEFTPAVIVLDLQMPKQDGIELLRGLASRDCKAAIIIASGLDGRVLTTALQLGATLGLSVVDTVCKPIAVEQLRELLIKYRHDDKLITPEMLSKALSEGQFEVHYLPKLSRKAPEQWIIDGAEALIRWRHPKYGLLLPTHFLGVAERSGMIVELTDFIFSTAMRQTSAWFAQGLYAELGLNLTASFLADLEFPDRMITAIKEHNLDASMVTLELTESAAAMDPELAMATLARLRVKRINLCLDDFGAGHSSLTHLYRMPFNEVKLDNTFINDMRTNEDARHIVEGLIFLAHKLKMTACAEGVEDEATFRMLEAIACDRVQGHYIGQAMPADQFETVARDWNSGRSGQALSKTA